MAQTGTEVELGNIEVGFDNIGSYIDDKFGPARSYIPSLDSSLTSFETSMTSQMTAVTGAGTTASEGVDSLMADMGKQQMTACAALGLSVNGMFNNVLDGISTLADGLIFKPINAVLSKIKEWFSNLPSISFSGLDGTEISNLISAISGFIGTITSAISGFVDKIANVVNIAVDAVGDVLANIYEVSGLKDLATSLLSGVSGIIGCGEDFIKGLGGISPAVLAKNPTINASTTAANHALDMAGPNDSLGDILSEAKNKAVAELNLDGLVDGALDAGSNLVNAVKDLAGSEPDIQTDVPDFGNVPGMVYA